MNTPIESTGAPRRVLVTGGSRGIGAATALRCAQQGWDVAVNYARDAQAAEAVCAQVRALGRQALAVQADVADEAEVLAMFDTIDRTLGPIGALVNNAGVVAENQRVADMTVQRLQRIFNTNVVGSFVCAREAVRRMSTLHASPQARAAGGGRGGAIVNLSSKAAVLGAPGWYVDYAASKGAIDTFTVGLARELALEGIRVNGVRPGIVDTDIHASGGWPDRAHTSSALIPMQRPGRPDEVAAAIAWLLSDDASYTTGAMLDVAGGR
ncbi:SDR family oxidoreductase [Aquincola sp. J276]|uniref:SDR family oxidoreductase n=1 Tax=Aquincola sp. J276 TaxID=2898432 RepID=UPI00215160E2|nr:SDR family oxidoreductase [Aquincola sp. J276]MCR5865964.1 SDR family oxidoreductase [Aquincola sp. J276]